MKYPLLLLSFIVKVYSFNKNIIVLPMKIGVFAHNKIKDSFINFYSRHVQMEFLYGSIFNYEEYYFEVDKDLTNIVTYSNFPFNSLNVDKQKKLLILTSKEPSDNDFMKATNRILYILDYINNKFYSKDKEKNYLYFGGIPQNINENYNLFSFKGLKYINFKMEVNFDNGTIYETKNERNKISFSSNDKYIISL